MNLVKTNAFDLKKANLSTIETTFWVELTKLIAQFDLFGTMLPATFILCAYSSVG